MWRVSDAGPMSDGATGSDLLAAEVTAVGDDIEAFRLESRLRLLGRMRERRSRQECTRRR